MHNLTHSGGSMRPQHGFVFPPFYLDPINRQLWRDAQLVRLRPKTFAVLSYLVKHAGELVTREDLRNAVWPDTYGTEDLPKRSVHELRKIFGDETDTPRFIETLNRRGWRFIADVQSPESNVQSQEKGTQKAKAKEQKTKNFLTQSSVFSSWSSVLVGREEEFTYLHNLLARADAGQRQVVFVTGEPGIGKTTLLEAFLSALRNGAEESQKSKIFETQSSVLSPQSLPSSDSRSPIPSLCIGHGQCIKQYGAGEAYLPVFEALTQLCHHADSQHLYTLARQYAPTWVVQMPGVLSAAEVDALLPRVAGATHERMLREFAEALEVFTREQAVVLWFDDLHDSDPSTLDLIAYLARRQQPARLLLIGTYRPAETLSPEHGIARIKQELRERCHWQELALEGLDEPTIAHYLKLRLRGEVTVPLSALAHAIHRRTEGNPLFLVNMVEDWQSQQILVQKEERWELQVTLPEAVAHIPATLHSTLLGQLHALQPEEQTVLEAASVAGLHFTVPVISAAIGKSLLDVEEICEHLARRERFIVRDGTEEWPDRTLATRYRFRHALHQDVAYQRIAPLKRLHWHQQIGERRESAFASEVATVAVELAMHFEQSRDYERAVRYLQLASSHAVQRSTYHEAITLANKGLELLPQLPASPQRAQTEMAFHITLAVSFTTTIGCAAPEVQQASYRALELSRQADDDVQLFPALSVLFGFYLVSSQLQTAREVGERLLRLAEQQPEPLLKLAAHLTLAVVLWQMGEPTVARSHFDQRDLLYSPQDHLKFLQFGHDPTVTSLAYATPVLWSLGYPEQARRAAQKSVALAEQLAHSYTLCVAIHRANYAFHSGHEVSLFQTLTHKQLTLSREQDFREGIARGLIMQGWILAQQKQPAKGIGNILNGIAMCEAIGTQMDRSYHLAVLAEVYALNSQFDEGLAALDDALQHVEKTGERYYEAEVYRLKGQLVLASGGRWPASNVTDPRPLAPDPQGEAEECFLKAVAIAKQQQAKSLQLRAVMSLVCLRQQQALEHGVASAVVRKRERKEAGKRERRFSGPASQLPGSKLAEAHQMLSDVYNWFTEGFETKDLQEAKALLASLASIV